MGHHGYKLFWTPLHTASAKGNFEAALQLLLLDADPGAIGGFFPHEVAAACGYADFARKIVEFYDFEIAEFNAENL